jgi:DNA-binding CsgD family transcriptional regulator
MSRVSARDLAQLRRLVHELHALVGRLGIATDGEPGLRTPSAGILPAGRLTDREAEVLGWLVEGKTNAEIARILAAQPRTVDKHCERIYQKLGVEDRTAAVRQALIPIDADRPSRATPKKDGPR